MSVAPWPEQCLPATSGQASSPVTAGSQSATEALRGRLRRHYCKPGLDRPGGVFVPEVGLNSPGRQRRCDAVWVGFTAGSGQRMIGHEIKVSRPDWRHELDDLEKAETWASQCHAWYIVAPSTAIVPPQEIPAGSGWGLMIPSPRSRNRMTIVVQATLRPENHQPSWLITRSVLARLDTIHAAALWQTRQDADQRIREHIAEEQQGWLSLAERAASQEAERDRVVLDRLEQELGINLRRLDDSVPLVDARLLALAIQIAQNPQIQWDHALESAASRLRRVSDQLGDLAADVTRFRRSSEVALDRPGDVADRGSEG